MGFSSSFSWFMNEITALATSETVVLRKKWKTIITRYGVGIRETISWEGRLFEGTSSTVWDSLSEDRRSDQAFPAGRHGRNPEAHGRLE
jgi:hypothetical protein